jgi:N-acyl-D-amino-acid deacylase
MGGSRALIAAVRRMTGFNAERMQLRDRGHVAQGLAADLVVFDPATVADDWNKAQLASRRSF